MSLSKLFFPFAVKLHAMTAQAGGAVYVDDVQSLGLNSELRTAVAGGDGMPYNTFGSLVSGAPAARFSTGDLKAFLDACGVTGMLIDADGTHPGVVVYRQKAAQGGTRQTGANHLSATLANGILVPRTLSLPHQGDAMLECEAVARKESTTAPVAFDEAATLPSTYAQTAVRWTLGKVDLNGTQFDGLKNVSIDFGIELVVEGSDSDIYPTVASIRRIQPSITISGLHADLTSTFTEDGVSYSASQVVIYAKKRSEGGTFVADGTAEHIKFTLGKCRVDWTSIDGDPVNIATRITPWYTAGASPVTPITINTASAIT